MTIRDPLSIESRSDDARVCLSAVALGMRPTILFRASLLHVTGRDPPSMVAPAHSRSSNLFQSSRSLITAGTLFSGVSRRITAKIFARRPFAVPLHDVSARLSAILDATLGLTTS
jgi:hypothetical protein